MADAIIDIKLRDDVSAPAAKVVSSLDAINAATSRIHVGMAGVTKASGTSSQAVQEFGRAFQDIAQGGLAGGINNIEGMVRGLGGTAGLAAAATIAGSAFIALKPIVEAFIEDQVKAKTALGEFITTWRELGTYALPAASTRFEEVSKSIKTMTERLEELTKKGRLSLKETFEFDKLTTDLKGAKEEFRDLTLVKTESEKLSPAQAERAGAVRQGIGASGAGVAGTLDALTEAFARTADEKGRVVSETGVKGTAQQVAVAVLAEALRGGSAEIAEMLKMLGPESKIGGAIRTEQDKRFVKQEELDKKLDDEEVEMARRRSNDLGKALEEQGKENERFEAKRLKDEKEADKWANQEEIKQLEGRKTWLKTLGKEERAPKIFDSMQSYLASIQTAQKGKDPQLERMITLMEMQIDALKGAAQVGT